MSDSEDETAERQIKIALVGEASCGKTCLATRYCHEEFSRQYYPTAGVDFFLKRISISGTRNATLHVWDIGGQSRVGNMLDKYIFGADVVMLVFDITNPVSFDNLEDWLKMVHRVASSQETQPMIVLVGTKCDLEHQRKVKHERQNKFAQEFGLTSYLVSARTGEMVALCFQKAVADLLGLKLSRAEQEEQQPVMQAEILHTPANSTMSEAAASNMPIASSSKSSVCEIQ